MSMANDRNRAGQLAVSSPEKALALAENILDPWYSAQALAGVLRYGPDHRTGMVCRRGLKKAAQCHDAYSRGAVLAWLVRALAERGQPALATAALEEATREIRQTTPASSRAEGLILLYQAAWPLGPKAATPLLRQLLTVQQSEPDPHWRTTRALVHALAMHSVLDPATFPGLLAAVGNAKVVTRIHRAMALGLTSPRGFFFEA